MADMKRLRAFQIRILVGALLGLLSVAAQDVSFKSSPLKGIQTLAVQVEKLSEAALRIGLKEEAVRTAAELRLKREGVAIADNLAYPCLYEKISVAGPVCAIRLEIREEATLTRIPLSFRVTTWYAESSGAHGGSAGMVMAALQERLDGLIRDYYKANPGT